jgi:hypothetical protein
VGQLSVPIKRAPRRNPPQALGASGATDDGAGCDGHIRGRKPKRGRRVNTTGRSEGDGQYVNLPNAMLLSAACFCCGVIMSAPAERHDVSYEPL